MSEILRFQSKYAGAKIESILDKADKLVDTENYTYSSNADGFLVLKGAEYKVFPTNRLSQYTMQQATTSNVTVSSDLANYSTDSSGQPLPISVVNVNEPVTKAIAMLNKVIKAGRFDENNGDSDEGSGGSSNPDSSATIVEAPSMRTTRNNPTLVQQFINVAGTYLAHRDDIYSTNPTRYYMVYGNNSILDTNLSTREIDCSAYVGLVLRGIPYESTPYTSPAAAVNSATLVANPSYNWSRNPQYYEYKWDAEGNSGSVTPVRNAGQLAEWMINMGWSVPIDNKLINLEVGDIIFYAKHTKVGSERPFVSPDRYKQISHVAICTDKCSTTNSAVISPWATSATYGYADWVNARSTRFPIAHRITHVTGQSGVEASCVKQSVVEKYYEESWSTACTKTGYQTIALVCRPDLGSLN